jgi:hypothetical protein
MHPALYAPSDDASYSWRLEPGSVEDMTKRKTRLGQSVKVGEIAGHLGGGGVYVGRLPAMHWEHTQASPSVWVQQSATGGGVVIRQLHQSELQRLFRTSHTFMSPGEREGAP